MRGSLRLIRKSEPKRRGKDQSSSRRISSDFALLCSIVRVGMIRRSHCVQSLELQMAGVVRNLLLIVRPTVATQVWCRKTS
jgi:hypothetical protein